MKKKKDRKTNKKTNKKTRLKKELALDRTIIEHMACLEINRLILQPPFHLVGDIKKGDKGISFDGEIEVYSNWKLEKSNFVNKVPVQVKGTTKLTDKEKANVPKKFRHPVYREDLKNYYEHGRGILYFVVTINTETYERQAYYRILAPLDLKGLLQELESNGNASISIDFYILKEDSLETICNEAINLVKKQPQQYVEATEEMDFTYYQVEFTNVDKDSFNIFEATAYIYGFNSDSIGKPVEATKITGFKKTYTENVLLNNEENCVEYYTMETKEEYTVIIENTLTVKYNKEKKSGSFSLERLKTLSSYVKCLKLINHYKKHSEFPFQNFSLKGSVEKGGSFLDVEDKIGYYSELIDVCKQIGISEDYEFNNNEDLVSLFGSIISIFKNKQYHLMNVNDSGDLNETLLHEIQISDYVRVKLIYTNGNFISFYSEEALDLIRGLLPLKAMEEKLKEGNELPEDWKKGFLKISIYATQKIEEMMEDANFNFEIVKLSFSEEYHDVAADIALKIPLDYMHYYNKFKDDRCLELVLKINRRYLEAFPQNDIPVININLVKLMRGNELTEEEQNVVWDIKERAIKNGDRQTRFACEVLIKDKLSAKRIFNSLREEEKEIIMSFPIYDYYEELK